MNKQTEKLEKGRKIIVKLLKRAKGCTKADVLKATKWKAVGIVAQAKAVGVKVAKVITSDGETRYYVD